MSSPLLEPQLLPTFSQIKVEQIEPAIDQILTDNRELVAKLVSEQVEPSWDSLVSPLEEMNDRLAKAWSPVSHMNAVVNSDEL
ncbi:MAG: oligopeptidase A, partial [Neptuniibacter sp.]